MFFRLFVVVATAAVVLSPAAWATFTHTSI